MLKQIKLLKETYKTIAGAQKRCAFENGIAAGEFRRGDKARLYLVVQEGDAWRVARCIKLEA